MRQSAWASLQCPALSESYVTLCGRSGVPQRGRSPSHADHCGVKTLELSLNPGAQGTYHILQRTRRDPSWLVGMEPLRLCLPLRWALHPVGLRAGKRDTDALKLTALSLLSQSQ